MQDRFQRSRIDLKFIVSDIKSPQIQCQSETAPGGGDSRTRGEEPDLAQSLPALYHVLLYKCQIPTSQVSSYTPVQ